VLPIEKLISEMRADIIERRKAPTYIKATRKWVKAELREAADIEWEANRIEKAWLDTKQELDKAVS
jgi:hypothetical protein